MTPAQARWNHAANLLVGGTGLVFGWMRYFARPTDEFALVNHPLEPALQRWHILLAPLLIFTVANVWSPHVWARIRSGFRARRATGLTLAALFWPMAASGYLLQTSTAPAWRQTWVVLHVATSLAWMAFLGLHLSRPRRSARGTLLGD